MMPLPNMEEHGVLLHVRRNQGPNVCLFERLYACMQTKKCAYLSLLVLLETELKDLDIKSQAYGQTDTKHFRDFHMLAVV